MGEVIPLPQRFSDLIFTTEPQLHRWDQNRDVEDIDVLDPVNGERGSASTSTVCMRGLR